MKHLVLAALASAILSAAPVGHVASTESFRLSGALVRPAGVPSWPVSAGDVIATSSGEASLVFNDGSRVTLSKNTRVVIEQADAAVGVRLQAGALRYSLDPKTAYTVAALKRKALPSEYREGWLSVAGTQAYFGSVQEPAAAAAFTPAGAIRITPFNLGYVDALCGQPAGGTPPSPPPGGQTNPPPRPPAVSNHRP